MKGIFGCLAYILIGLFLLGLLIEVLPDLIGIALIGGATWYGVKWFKNRKVVKGKTVQLKKMEAKKNTLEYKMERLLNIAGYPDENRTKRQQYLHKESLNLRDKWYKFIDLRAKLALNGTSTHREEEVLNMMCDELIYRIDNTDVEVSEMVRKEFIEQHLAPLIQDVIDIVDGIRPMETINMNAYELLKEARLEREPIRLKKQ